LVELPMPWSPLDALGDTIVDAAIAGIATNKCSG
jgi:hypothetical protein